MRSHCLHLLAIVILLTIYCQYSKGYHIPAENSELSSHDAIEEFLRQKRDLENFDDDYPTASSQDVEEEPSFWDRVVKVALKLFNKFMEWLNS